MTKKSAAGVVVLILLLIAFLGFFLYRQRSLQQTAQNLPLVDNNRGTPESPLQDSDITTQPSTTAYYFEGYFTDKPFVTNGIIMADFFLKDDPNKELIRVVFTDEDGNFSIGRSSETQIQFEMLDASTLFDFIEPNRVYELRIFQGEPTNDAETAILEQLNQLKSDTNIEEYEYSLAPSMIRSLE